MEAFKDFRKTGVFHLPPDRQVQGELLLKGDQSTLELFSREMISTRALDGQSITGVLRDGTKVSLINCIDQGSGSNSRGSELFHFASIFPHFAIFGDEHISSADPRISNVRFLVEDAAAIFYDFDAFGSVYDARELVNGIAEAKSDAGRSISVGDNPMVFYFAGRHEITSAGTVLGTVSVSHNLSVQSPGPTGIHVDNKIFVNVELREPSTVATAIEVVQTLLRFLEIIAGRPQSIHRLFFDLSGEKEKTRPLDVYWSMFLKPAETKESPHPADLPIRAVENREAFESILQKWLQRNDSWRNARFRFSSSLHQQNNFTIDRLVGAANMFDILPSSAVPKTVDLPADVIEAAQTSRSAFEKIAEGPQRQSILDALGRLKKVGLRLKIQHRAKVLTDLVPQHFPELDFVIKEAVSCRNHFVHGSKSKIDYSRNFDPVIFFTETLEFVFAASDLVESGWDIAEWATRPSSMSHPFARYRHGYAAELNRLKGEMASNASSK